MGSYLSLVFYCFIFIVICLIYNSVDRRNTNIIANKSKNIRYISKRKVKTICLYIMILSIVCIIMFVRKEIGTDYHLYELYCQEYENHEINFESIYGGINTEIIPMIFVKIAYKFTNTINVFNLLCALFSYAFLVPSLLYYKRENKLWLMSFITLVLLFAPSMNILRQIMALSVFIWGFRFCCNKEYKKYILCCLLATLCHSSGIVTFAFILFNLPKKKNVIYDRLILFLSLLLPFAFVNIFEVMGEIGFFSKYVAIYSSQIDFQFDYRYLLVKAPVIIALIIFWKKLESKEEDNRIFLLLFVVEIVAILMGSWMEWAFRVMYYGYLAEIVLIPQICSLFKGEKKIIVTILIVLYYFSYFFILHFYYSYDGIFPFTF